MKCLFINCNNKTEHANTFCESCLGKLVTGKAVLFYCEQCNSYSISNNPEILAVLENMEPPNLLTTNKCEVCTYEELL